MLDFLLFNLFAMLADRAGEVMFSTVRKGWNPIECKLSAGFNNVPRCDVVAVGTLDIALGLSYVFLITFISPDNHIDFPALLVGQQAYLLKS